MIAGSGGRPGLAPRTSGVLHKRPVLPLNIQICRSSEVGPSSTPPGVLPDLVSWLTDQLSENSRGGAATHRLRWSDGEEWNSTKERPWAKRSDLRARVIHRSGGVVTLEEAQTLLRWIAESVCGEHSSGQTVFALRDRDPHVATTPVRSARN